MRVASADRRSCFVEVSGPEFLLGEWGWHRRPTVLGLPSGPGFSQRTIGPWLGGLDQAFRVATIDLPGSGRASLAPGLDYGFDSYSADLAHVCATLAADKLVVLGHGWGAAMAIEFALRCPGMMAALILVNPLRIFTAAGQDSAAQARMVARVDPTVIDDWINDVGHQFAAALAGEIAWESIEELPWWSRMVRTQFAAVPPRRWDAALAGEPWRMRAYATYKGAAMFDPASAMASYNLAERAASLAVPTLILACEHDANYVAPPDRHAIPLARAILGSRLELWTDAGHFPFVERPAAFAQLLADFLAKTGIT